VRLTVTLDSAFVKRNRENWEDVLGVLFLICFEITCKLPRLQEGCLE
jgi:hypothetical protein